MTEAEAVTLGRHHERLCDLEKRADRMELSIGRIEGNTNKMLGGISIACILLVINMAIMLAGKAA